MATYTYSVNQSYSQITMSARLGFSDKATVESHAKANIPAYSTVTNVKLSITCRQGYKSSKVDLYMGAKRTGDTANITTVDMFYVNKDIVEYNSKTFSSNDSNRDEERDVWEASCDKSWISDLTTLFQSGTANAGCFTSAWSDFETFYINLACTLARRIEVTNMSLTWTYTPPTYYTVTVNAGTGGSVSGGGSYRKGTSATVTATPAAGYSFAGWANSSGTITVTTNPYTFTVNSNTTFSAVFKPNKINKIYCGNKQPKVYVGNTEVKAVYVGNTKIYG